MDQPVLCWCQSDPMLLFDAVFFAFNFMLLLV
jgi:hypothetical protein